MADFSFDRHAFWAGFRDIVPLAVPGIPFGFVLGVVIAESGLDRFVAWLSSPIVLAGASQLAAIELLAESTGAAVVLVTVAFINSRHLMYSAVLRPTFANFPTWFKILGPYLLIDQAFALVMGRHEDENIPPALPAARSREVTSRDRMDPHKHKDCEPIQEHVRQQPQGRTHH